MTVLRNHRSFLPAATIIFRTRLNQPHKGGSLDHPDGSLSTKGSSMRSHYPDNSPRPSLHPGLYPKLPISPGQTNWMITLCFLLPVQTRHDTRVHASFPCLCRSGTEMGPVIRSAFLAAPRPKVPRSWTRLQPESARAEGPGRAPGRALSKRPSDGCKRLPLPHGASTRPRRARLPVACHRPAGHTPGAG